MLLSVEKWREPFENIGNLTSALCLYISRLQGARGFAAAAAAAQKEIKLPPQYDVPGRYASALYMAAAKADQLGKVEKELSDIGSLLKESAKLRSFLSDPSVSAAKRLEGMDAILKKMEASDITKRFVDLVVKNKRSADLAAMVDKFGDISAEQRGLVNATVTTAQALKPAELEKVKKGLMKVLSPGQSLVLEQRVDPSIIAGVVIDIGDRHVDMSVLSRVKKLQQLIREAV